MKLNEIFAPGSKRILPWKQEECSPYKCLYSFPFSEQVSYEVVFMNQGDGAHLVDDFDVDHEDAEKMDHVWEIIFGVNTADGYREDILSTGGKEILVFGTIIDIVRNFLRQNRPTTFIFVGKEPSRRRLYARFAKELAKIMGGNVRQSKDGSEFLVSTKLSAW